MIEHNNNHTKENAFSPQISIITAAYNVERYLPMCLNSILSQTFRDFELILIDDGSTDSTGEICDYYAGKDSRIRVIHQENKGVSDSWNLGLQNVRGRYVGFVDADDMIFPEMYDLLYKAVTELSGDISFCDYKPFFEDCVCAPVNSSSDPVFRISSTEEELVRTTKPYSASFIWKGLYRYECIKDLRFLSKMKWQDKMWSPCAILNANRIIRVNRVLYMYRQRSESSSHSNLFKNYANGLFVYNNLLDHLKQNAPIWYPMYSLKVLSECISMTNRSKACLSIDEQIRLQALISDSLSHFSNLSIFDILSEPHTEPSRKLIAVAGKLSFSLACNVKCSLLDLREQLLLNSKLKSSSIIDEEYEKDFSSYSYF